MKRGYIEDRIYFVLITLMLSDGYLTKDYLDNFGGPEFGSHMKNITVIQGREAVFTCTVRKLGQHKVAWIKADTKGVLAIQDKVLTNFGKLSVTHEDMHTWTLHIKDVRRSDRGDYMCQVNTNPLRAQTGRLNVVVPPDIFADVGGEVLIPEGGTAKLSCKAKGYPKPQVQWRREDGKEIIVRGENGIKKKALIFDGEVLQMHKVTRTDMGSYFCIASNGYPPSVSRRVVLTVHFPPSIHPSLQLVGAPSGTDVMLECTVEASPKAISYWAKSNGDLVLPGDRIRTEETELNTYTVRMRLIIRRVEFSDFSGYKCAAKNSVGESEGYTRLYEMKLESTKPYRMTTPTTTVYRLEPDYYEDNYDNINAPVQDVTQVSQAKKIDKKTFIEKEERSVSSRGGEVSNRISLFLILYLTLYFS
ncbi:lachesin-like isoform X2 [Artemia franciscana]|uniref:Ig-like domain-containing protein n=1 Tax=Artemia franciscana TaxID=6661 RepID=A0AA88HBF7_ARTSF|nr:hypothetical protein QYM36_016700 [Artemia franciscana]